MRNIDSRNKPVTLTFIFAAFLARLRPTSRRQSSRRVLRAAKQVLEFRSVSFSRLAVVLQLELKFGSVLPQAGDNRCRLSCVGFAQTRRRSWSHCAMFQRVLAL